MMKPTERLQKEPTGNAREWVGDFDYVARNSNGTKKKQTRKKKNKQRKKARDERERERGEERETAEWRKNVNEN